LAAVLISVSEQAHVIRGIEPDKEIPAQLLAVFTSADRRPGCHYRLIERCAEISGFSDMFITDPRPTSEVESDFPSRAQQATAEMRGVGSPDPDFPHNIRLSIQVIVCHLPWGTASLKAGVLFWQMHFAHWMGINRNEREGAPLAPAAVGNLSQRLARNCARPGSVPARRTARRRRDSSLSART